MLLEKADVPYLVHLDSGAFRPVLDVDDVVTAFDVEGVTSGDDMAVHTAS